MAEPDRDPFYHLDQLGLHVRRLLRGRSPEVPDRPTPFVSVDPAMRFGQPVINGTRLPVQSVVDAVWVEGVDVAAEEYTLTRADVLVACWYAGTYGLPGRRRSLFPVRLWVKRWGAWADSVAESLWKVTEVDYDAIPDPPRVLEKGVGVRA